MSASSRAGQLIRRASFWLAAGVALLVAHDAVFAAQMGPGLTLTRALRDAGHAYWGLASTLLLVGGATAGALWLARIAVLRHSAAKTPADHHASARWARRASAHWIRLFILVALAFLVQENAEHFLGHGHLIGVGALTGPEYPLALPVLALVTGLGAAVTALVREHEAELLRRIAATRARARRPLRRIRPARPGLARNRHGAPMSIHRGLRAPPSAVLHAHA